MTKKHLAIIRMWATVTFLCLVACFAVGCAEFTPRVLRYKPFDIVIADQYTVDRMCGTSLTDSGSYIGVHQHIAGCFDGAANPPRIIVDHEHPDVIVHELRHWDGGVDPEKEGYSW